MIQVIIPEGPELLVGPANIEIPYFLLLEKVELTCPQEEFLTLIPFSPESQGQSSQPLTVKYIASSSAAHWEGLFSSLSRAQL